jgi:hypothetical protein
MVDERLHPLEEAHGMRQVGMVLDAASSTQREWIQKSRGSRQHFADRRLDARFPAFERVEAREDRELHQSTLISTLSG